jgi:hypothetical protein
VVIAADPYGRNLGFLDRTPAKLSCINRNYLTRTHETEIAVRVIDEEQEKEENEIGKESKTN